MGIIRQAVPLFAVPDFRNLGVVAKILASSLLLMLIEPLFVITHNQQGYGDHLTQLAIWLAPCVLLSILVLSLLNRFLQQAPWAPLWVWLTTLTTFSVANYWFNRQAFDFWPHFWGVSLYTWGMMHYYALYRKALSPALSEARLAALTARIRPHFLFNSLNAAISLVRDRPADAEMVLENLADLFRAQLQSGPQSSTMGREIELAQGYIAIEQVRMGSARLHVRWNLQVPDDAEVPHLLLQPLLENAVYHGVEPLHRPGQIHVGIVRRQNWIYIRIDNPLPEQNRGITERKNGNQMAMVNLAERLHLMYDRDATLIHKRQGSLFRVDIRIPYRTPYQAPKPAPTRSKAA